MCSDAAIAKPTTSTVEAMSVRPGGSAPVPWMLLTLVSAALWSTASFYGRGLPAVEGLWAATTVQMLADGPLRHMDAMPGFQNRADLDCRASRQFQAELAGFLQEFGMATHRMPARLAAVTPFGESSMATASGAATPRQSSTAT